MMTYSIRAMELRDVSQVSHIEREAFPPPWPATNFKRELISSNLVHYFVACEKAVDSKEQDTGIEAVSAPGSRGSRLEVLKSWLKRLFGIKSSPAAPSQFVSGFAGLWFMADEAHVSNIAVSEAYRRQGIGERLLIAAIELAIGRKARFITLEVRASNKSAQALYRKYGLVEVGTRRGYYMDDKEDAVIMTAEAITLPTYLASFQRLKQAHVQRWGPEASATAK
jgi:ribosomal-protein-alanine N-acetyltransferase